jgi:fibronectin-binding autotransporter adhesin
VSTAFFNPAGQNPSIDLTVNGTLNATTLTMLRFSAFGGTRSTTLTVNPGAVVNVSSNLNLNDGTNPGGAATNSVTINVNGGTLSVNSLNPNSGTFGQGLGTNNRILNITNGGRLEVTIFGQYTPVGGGGGTGLAGTRQVTLNGGTIANRVGANANFGANVPMTLGTSGINAFEATAGQTITYGGTGNVLSGAGGFNKEGTGTFILGGADTYTGLTNINAGVLQMTTPNALGSAATGTNVNAGGTLNINGLTGVAEPLTLSGSGAAGQTGALVNNSGTAGSVTSNITLAADAGVGGTGVMTLSGVVSGNAALTKAGTGTTILSGVNTYSGATNVTAGTLRAGAPANGQAFGTNSAVTLANTAGAVLDLNSTNQTIGSLAGGGTTGGNVTLGSGTLTTGSNNTSTVYGGVLSGTGALLKTGSGTQTLTATNTYTGNTTITAGTLQLGDGVTNGSIAGNVTDNATLALDPASGTSVTLGGVISGSGNVNQIGLGTTILTGSNTYTGGTTIAAGTLQLGNGITNGSIVGNVVDNATLAIDPASGTTVTLGGVISGTGALNQIGAGTTLLTGANTYSGPTNVMAGALYVNGNQTAATGLTSVANGATLGGIGTLGDSVVIANGATLVPGNPGTAPGTLTIQGALTLNSGSLLSYRLGQANVPGGPMNDLTNVGGNLTLAGALNITPTSGGAFDPGVYRIVNYGGTLTNNGLALGTTPPGTFFVQTSVPSQVNLVNATGLTLNFWDGAAIANKNNSAVDGGSGIWQGSSGNDNWTASSGALNAPWASAAFAVFEATPGTVTVDSTTFGQVTTSGMQFASNGYVVQGDALSLLETTAGSGQTTIRVGDGTASGASDVATIASVLQGNTQLVKTDLGTLVLTGANTYTGGTVINGGTMQVSADANLGAASGVLSLDGGTLATTSSFSTSRATTLNSGGGTVDIAPSTTLTLGGVINGAGALTKTDTGTLVLTAPNTYTGGTTIAAGTLQLGDGVTNGSIAGNVTNNAILALDPANGTSVTLGGVISGSGIVNQIGAGTTVLAGANTYSGPTNVTAGALYINGNQSAATGGASVDNGATLGGIGTIGGNVTINGGATLAPGNTGTLPGTLTIQGDLTLDSGSRLSYRLGQANVPGGPMNDLTTVLGNLTLAGTLNITPTATGSFGPGLYRIVNYGGALTNNTLTLGSVPAGTTAVIQTSTPHEVNLVNITGLRLNVWDGAALANKNNNIIDGGDGAWQGATGNDNWTTSTGDLNAPWSAGAFALFQAAPGTVSVDNTAAGQVAASGAQFASNGYVIQGDALDLVETTPGSGQTTIRVGDGTAAGASDVATIASVLQGNTQLVKTDLGTLVLTAANTYTGGTAVNGGTVQVSADANLGASTAPLSFDGGTLATTASFSSNRLTALNAGGGTIGVAPNITLTLSGAIDGVGALSKANAGTLVLTAANTYTGGTTITSGTLQLGDGSTKGSIVGDVFDAGMLTFDRSDTLTFGGIISGTGGVNQIGTGTTLLTGSSTYSGATTVQAGRWAAGATNVFSPNSVYDVGPHGVLDLQSFDETVAGINNAGLVRIARDPGAMLTTTNYVGQGGTLALNTTLGDDASPTDHLVINGGSASGTSFLAITNINGPGAATISNGIPVIQASDGGTTAPGAFVLASGELRGGFYSYRLFRGGLDGDAPESWFLRSTFVVSQPPSTQPPSSSPPPGNVLPPDPPSIPLPPGRYPILGPEPATYSVVQPLARMQGLAMLGTLHERIGDTLTYPYATDDSEGWRRSGWARVVAQQIDNRYRSFTAPQADGSVAGLQTGLDLWRGEIWPGFDALGVYFAYSHSDVDANGLTTNASATDYVHGHTGTARLNGYSGGGYWTHYGATGWYVDGVVQGTHYDGPAKTAFAHLSVGGWGWATSLEAGYPMKISGGAGFVVEPQAQVVWQRVNLHDGHDGQSDVALGSTNGVSGRLGIRGQWTVRTQSDQLWQPYIRLNVWRDAGGEATTVYAGTGRVPLAQQATRIEAAVGTTAMLAHGISLYGQVGYQHSVNSSSDGTREGAWGNAGLRYNW